MAITTKFRSNLVGNILTTGTVVYQCPASNTATVIGLSLANKSANIVTSNIWIHRSGTRYYGAANVEIFSGSAFTPYGEPQKLVLQADDSINCSVSLANSIDTICSVLEVY